MASARDMSLAFITPSLQDGKNVAYLQKDLVEKELMKWQNTLIINVHGETSPTVTSMYTFIEREWRMVDKPTLLFHEHDGYFSAIFNSYDDMYKILCSGPYYVDGSLMIMRPWTYDMRFDEGMFSRVVPLWVRLPNLPLNCWGVDCLSRIGSVIGKPLCMDECTLQKSRICYARVLVDVDVTKGLVDSVIVEDPSTGRSFKQEVLFEWSPSDSSIVLHGSIDVKPAVLGNDAKEGGSIEEYYMEYMELGAVIHQLKCRVSNYRYAAMSNDQKYDHLSFQDKQKVLNACAETETWLNQKEQQEKTFPDHASPVSMIAHVKEKADKIVRLCEPILMKPNQLLMT